MTDRKSDAHVNLHACVHKHTHTHTHTHTNTHTNTQTQTHTHSHKHQDTNTHPQAMLELFDSNVLTSLYPP